MALNWRDVFGTRRWENYTESDTFWRHQKNWRDPRFNVQLTWNFGNMNNDKKRGEREELQPGNDDQQQQGGYGGGEE